MERRRFGATKSDVAVIGAGTWYLERAERKAARRGTQRSTIEPAGPLSRRYVLRAALVAFVAGLIGFSVQWSEGMPRALYVGLAVAAVVLLVALGFRYLMARASSAT